jgi:hypothetical protein
MGAILATIVIVGGMCATPKVMQMLFVQGHAFTGESGNPLSIARSSANLLSAQNASNAAKSGQSATSSAPPPAPLAARPGI